MSLGWVSQALHAARIRSISAFSSGERSSSLSSPVRRVHVSGSPRSAKTSSSEKAFAGGEGDEVGLRSVVEVGEVLKVGAGRGDGSIAISEELLADGMIGVDEAFVACPVLALELLGRGLEWACDVAHKGWARSVKVSQPGEAPFTLRPAFCSGSGGVSLSDGKHRLLERPFTVVAPRSRYQSRNAFMCPVLLAVKPMPAGSR